MARTTSRLMTRTPVLADGAHGQLGLERHPELADDDDVQRRAEGAGDLERDRDTAPRQAKDHDTPIAQVLQPGGQPPSRIGPIGENHGYLLSTPTFPRLRERHQGPSSPSADAQARAGARAWAATEPMSRYGAIAALIGRGACAAAVEEIDTKRLPHCVSAQWPPGTHGGMTHKPMPMRWQRCRRREAVSSAGPGAARPRYNENGG